MFGPVFAGEPRPGPIVGALQGSYSALNAMQLMELRLKQEKAAVGGFT